MTPGTVSSHRSSPLRYDRLLDASETVREYALERLAGQLVKLPPPVETPPPDPAERGRY